MQHYFKSEEHITKGKLESSPGIMVHVCGPNYFVRQSFEARAKLAQDENVFQMKNKLKAKVLGMWFKWQYACNSRL
jgi:hypothetical protein